MAPNSPFFTREELVNIVSEFYTFMTRFYIPSSALKFPPPGGWPNITPETTKNFRKASIVIDLIKHLPYINEEHANQMITNIHYKSDVVDYSTWTPENFAGKEPCGEMGLRWWWEIAQTQIRSHEEEVADEDTAEEGGNSGETFDVSNHADSVDEDDEGDEDSGVDCDESSDIGWGEDNPDDFDMENMIVLAKGYESGGRNIVLDVFKGNIHEDVIRCDLQSPVDADTFFKALREKYERLEMVPVPGSEMYEDVSDIAEEEEKHGTADRCRDDEQAYKRIYRKYGWPGNGYRKEEALRAIEAYWQATEDEELRE